MARSRGPALDHGSPSGDGPSFAEPIAPVADAPRPTPAEEARTIVAGAAVSTLASRSEDGHPWASLVAHACLDDGSPVLFVSTLAEHGRNLARDSAASLMVAEDDRGRDPLGCGRVTLAGQVEEPQGPAADAAWNAYAAAVASASMYESFTDFTLWVLRVERVRWVGGYGRMDSAEAADYAAATPDPVAPGAHGAITHLNEDHADALLDMTRGLGGHPDATAATCIGIDRLGIDLRGETPRGLAFPRLAFPEPATEPGDLRTATVELTKRARAALD